MKRGAIYWVNLGKISPPEFGKTRLGLIVSNSIQNELLDSVVIVPLSSRPGEIWPLRLEIQTLQKPSFAVLPGLRQVSKSRLLKSPGTVDSQTMERVDQALNLYLQD